MPPTCSIATEMDNTADMASKPTQVPGASRNALGGPKGPQETPQGLSRDPQSNPEASLQEMRPQESPGRLWKGKKGSRRPPRSLQGPSESPQASQRAPPEAPQGSSKTSMIPRDLRRSPKAFKQSHRRPQGLARDPDLLDFASKL